MKAEPYWSSYQFYTGDEEEDMQTRREVAKLILASKYVIHWVMGLVKLTEKCCFGLYICGNL